jgi:hypothetical protein
VARRPGTGKGSRLPQEPSSLRSVAQPLNPDNKHKLIRGVYKECHETLVLPAKMLAELSRLVPTGTLLQTPYCVRISSRLMRCAVGGGPSL